MIILSMTLVLLSGAGGSEATKVAPNDSASVYVLQPSLSGLPKSVGDTVSAAIAQVTQSSGLSVMTKAEAQKIIENQAELAQLGAMDNDLSLAALAKALGADHLIATNVSASGQDTVLLLRLIDARGGKVLSRRQVKVSDYDGDVIAAVTVASQLILAPIFGHLRGTLKLEVSEEGANVLWDEEQIGVTPIELFSSAGGVHLLSVSKEGFIRHQESLEIVADGVVERIIRLRPSPEFLRSYKKRNKTYRALAWGTGATALASVGALVAFVVLKGAQDGESRRLSDGYEVLSPAEQFVQKSEFDEQIAISQNSANQLGTGAIISGAVAGVSALTSGYFWIFGDNPKRYNAWEEEVLAK